MSCEKSSLENFYDIVGWPSEGPKEQWEQETLDWLGEYRRTKLENERLSAMIERSNLEEVDGFIADGPLIKKTGRILVPKDRIEKEQQITDALRMAAKHAHENARLCTALNQILLILMQKSKLIETGELKEVVQCVNTALYGAKTI